MIDDLRQPMSQSSSIDLDHSLSRSKMSLRFAEASLGKKAKDHFSRQSSLNFKDRKKSTQGNKLTLNNDETLKNYDVTEEFDEDSPLNVKK